VKYNINASYESHGRASSNYADYAGIISPNQAVNDPEQGQQQKKPTLAQQRKQVMEQRRDEKKEQFQA
jgi:hypothetical protein